MNADEHRFGYSSWSSKPKVLICEDLRSSVADLS